MNYDICVVEVRGGVAEPSWGNVKIIDWDEIGDNLNYAREVVDWTNYDDNPVPEHFKASIRTTIYEVWPELDPDELDENEAMAEEYGLGLCDVCGFYCEPGINQHGDFGVCSQFEEHDAYTGPSGNEIPEGWA